MQDEVVNEVCKKLADRSAAGIAKYGTTTERTDLSRLDWLRHAQEELLVGALYLEKLIQDEEESARRVTRVLQSSSDADDITGQRWADG